MTDRPVDPLEVEHGSDGLPQRRRGRRAAAAATAAAGAARLATHLAGHRDGNTDGSLATVRIR